MRAATSAVDVTCSASEVADIDLPGNRVTSNSDAFEYHFTLQKPSGGQTKIRLLRNGNWLSKQERTWQYSAAAGDWDWHYWIALSELGVEGWSRLEAAQPYSGSHDLALGANGGLVTGIFEHEGSVVDLRFVNESSEEVAITSTPNHRFWSDSRQAFIACGELERGELVRGLTGGQWQLQARESQPDARTVYNLEVSQEHVFYVGPGGILVHNMCDTGSQGGKHSGGDISGSGRTPANRLTPEAPPTSAPNSAAKTFDTIPEGRRLTTYWPPNRGFSGTPVRETLQPGTRIDRYGFDGGTFVSPQGVPAPMRSLAPGTTDKPYSVFEVVKPLDVQSGRAAPWFGQPGGGTQFEIGKSIKELLEAGIIRRVDP